MEDIWALVPVLEGESFGTSEPYLACPPLHSSSARGTGRHVRNLPLGLRFRLNLDNAYSIGYTRMKTEINFWHL